MSKQRPLLLSLRAKQRLEVQAATRIQHHGQTLWLSTERCIYWEEQQMLIASDLHFGKTGHFRKSGIGVPQNVYKEDLQRLVSQVQYFKPQQLLVVGDLFHSAANKELDLFLRWRSDLPHLGIRLVKGNHDILRSSWYAEAAIDVAEEHVAIDNFCFVHDISHTCEPSENVTYYFSGHIHPCVSLRGMGRQALKLPCYYFAENYAVQPAFGRFTGTALIEPRAKDDVYAILPGNGARQETAVIMKIH